jgi:uncharacterized damage-inducible protein DinB
MRKLSFKNQFTVLIAAGALWLLPIQAGNELTAAIAKHWATSHAFTIAVAEAMPADGYSYVPPSSVQPPERTFAGLLIHIGESDANFVGKIAALENSVPKPPAPGTTDKDVIIRYLNDVHEFTTKAIEGLTEEQLTKMVGPARRPLPGQEALLGIFTHEAHTRAQCEVYLRLKNVKPPAYMF